MNPTPLPDRADVVIVGAGATGLALACSLTARGLTPLVLDRAVAGANTSRAAVVHARGVVASTHRLTRAATARNPLVRTGRNAAVAIAGRLPSVRRALALSLSGLSAAPGSSARSARDIPGNSTPHEVRPCA